VIDFRYHLVSIVAVFLALAIGIVIGASAIKPGVLNVLDNASSREQRQIASKQAQIRNLENQLGSNQAFAQANAPRLLSGLLAGQQVALVTAPGADATTVNGVTAALELAGAKITTQAELQPSFFDTSASTQKSLETLAVQVAPPGLVLTAPPGANPKIAGQQEAAQVLAAALVTKDGADLPADQVKTILSGFTDQGFLQLSPAAGATPPSQATLAVVIVPASPPSADADPANLALISLAEQLRLSGPSQGGVVLAGSLAGSGAGSAIDELISGSTGAQLSSVNNADKEIGQILVVQALSYLLTGHKPAAYGTGAVPTPAPTPSATPSAAPAVAPSHAVRA
jgi:Copper transport outer membrane protein, MctB